MRNKVIILTLSVIMVLCSSFSVFASSVVNLDMTEPNCSDTQGYLVTADESLKNVNVFYWSINPYVANGENQRGTLPSMNLVLNDDSITLTALYSGTARMTLTRVFNSSTQWVLKSANFTNSSSYEHLSTNPIKYFCYNGNIGMVDDNVSSTGNYLSVNWGHDASYQEEFDELINLLESLDGSVDNLYDKSISINSSLSNIESDTSDIKSEVSYVNENLVSVFDELVDCEVELNRINGKLADVKISLQQELLWLETISGQILNLTNKVDKLVSSVGKEDTSKLDDSSLSENESYSDTLLNEQSVGQVDSALNNINDSLNVTLNSEGVSALWDWVNRSIFSHDKILLLFFFCLSMGVIKLILNR